MAIVCFSSAGTEMSQIPDTSLVLLTQLAAQVEQAIYHDHLQSMMAKQGVSSQIMCVACVLISARPWDRLTEPPGFDQTQVKDHCYTPI